MRDPRRIKLTGRINAQVKFNPTGEIVDLYSFADKKILKRILPESLKEAVKSQIGRVNDKPNTVIYSMSSSFSYSEPDAMKDFDFGNVFVEAYLPYCLHLPNHIEMQVSIPEESLDAQVIFEKIWTKRAQTDEGRSDDIDFYAENHPLYFRSSTVLGPNMPPEPEEGCEPNITGKNVEKINDRSGTFRYTRVYLQFNTALPKRIEMLSRKSHEQLIKQIQTKSLNVVNRIIDNYREITGEIHVRRLGEINIILIYFKDQNTGVYQSNLNTTTAMINRSRKEINELSSRLESGIKPDIYKLLLLNARNSLDSKDYTLAIVESFQALEIFIENYLVSEFKKRGDQESEYRKILEKHWNTKQRLNEVLDQLKYKTLNKQPEIWDKWCHRYDKTRNEVIHAGKDPTEDETKETLEINEAVIKWVLKL